jgi:hypothetical protein
MRHFSPSPLACYCGLPLSEPAASARWHMPEIRKVALSGVKRLLPRSAFLVLARQTLIQMHDLGGRRAPKGAIIVIGESSLLIVASILIPVIFASGTSVTAQNLGVSALSFSGVDPTGTTNSSIGLSKAIAAAYATGNGGALTVPCGTYLLTDGLTLPAALGSNKAVRLEGIQTNCTTLKVGANNVVAITANVMSHISNLTIDCNGFSTGTGGILSWSGVAVENVNIIGGCRYPTALIGNSSSTAGTWNGISIPGFAGTYYSQWKNVSIDGAFSGTPTSPYGIYAVTLGTPPFVGYVGLNKFDFVKIRNTTTAGVYNLSGGTLQIVNVDVENTPGLGIDNEYGVMQVVTGDCEQNVKGSYYNNPAYMLNGNSSVWCNSTSAVMQSVSTTGSMASSTAILNVASSANISPAQALYVAGANFGSGRAYSRVVSVSGTTVTLANTTSVSVSSGAVYGPVTPQFVAAGLSDVPTAYTSNVYSESLHFHNSEYLQDSYLAGTEYLYPKMGTTTHQMYAKGGTTDWYIGDSGFNQKFHFNFTTGILDDTGGYTIRGTPLSSFYLPINNATASGTFAVSGSNKLISFFCGATLCQIAGSYSSSGYVPLLMSAGGVSGVQVGTGSTTLIKGGVGNNVSTATNTDNRGTITLASGAGSYTFTQGPGAAGSWTSAPVCVFFDKTTSTNAVVATVTAASISLTGTGSDAVNYICWAGN